MPNITEHDYSRNGFLGLGRSDFNKFLRENKDDILGMRNHDGLKIVYLENGEVHVFGTKKNKTVDDHEINDIKGLGLDQYVPLSANALGGMPSPQMGNITDRFTLDASLNGNGYENSLYGVDGLKGTDDDLVHAEQVRMVAGDRETYDDDTLRIIKSDGSVETVDTQRVGDRNVVVSGKNDQGQYINDPRELHLEAEVDVDGDGDKDLLTFYLDDDGKWQAPIISYTP